VRKGPLASSYSLLPFSSLTVYIYDGSHFGFFKRTGGERVRIRNQPLYFVSETTSSIGSNVDRGSLTDYPSFVTGARTRLCCCAGNSAAQQRQWPTTRRARTSERWSEAQCRSKPQTTNNERATTSVLILLVRLLLCCPPPAYHPPAGEERSEER